MTDETIVGDESLSKRFGVLSRIYRSVIDLFQTFSNMIGVGFGGKESRCECRCNESSCPGDFKETGSNSLYTALKIDQSCASTASERPKIFKRRTDRKQRCVQSAENSIAISENEERAPGGLDNILHRS